MIGSGTASRRESSFLRFPSAAASASSAKPVRFALVHAGPMRLDDGPGDRLGHVALPGARRSVEERILVTINEVTGGSTLSPLHGLHDLSVEVKTTLTQVGGGRLPRARLTWKHRQAAPTVRCGKGAEPSRYVRSRSGLPFLAQMCHTEPPRPG